MRRISVLVVSFWILTSASTVTLAQPAEVAVAAQPSAVAPGDDVALVLTIGSAQSPVSDLLGAGMQLRVNASVIRLDAVELGNFLPVEDAVHFERLDTESGVAAVAVALTDGSGSDGFGRLATVTAHIQLGALPGVYALSLEDVRLVTPDGSDISVAAVGGSLHVLGTRAACCFGDGSCQMVDRVECEAAGGTFHESDAGCNPNPCPVAARGACCSPGGLCVQLTESDCAGTYQGNGTVCLPNPCPQPPPTGACCRNVGTCIVVTAAQCPAGGGTYLGDGSACESTPCPNPVGACCKAIPRFGSLCIPMTEEFCGRFNGVFLGANTTCRPNPCRNAIDSAPSAEGACCLQTGDCVIAEQNSCALASGSFLGVGGVCDPKLCGDPKALSTWGRVKARYR